MELKRIYGKKERILYTCPNALVNQYASSFAATFPKANIITLDSDLSPSEREMVLNMAVVSDFDVLIMPNSTFTALDAPIDTQRALAEQEIVDLEDALSKSEELNLSTKKIEKALERKEEALQDIISKPTLNSVTFEDLRITTLQADESQTFKNLPYVSSMSNVRGLNSPAGSKKAWDFYVKVRSLQENDGRVYLSTGTSLSNSIVEASHLIRLLQPYQNQELHRVDSFIKLFAKPVTEFSIDATGQNFKLQTTLKSFTNLSELLKIYRQTAEVLSQDNLGNVLPLLPDGRCAIPPLKNGKITTITLESSPEQDAEFKKIVASAKKISKKNNMLKIIDHARKASLDIRHLQPLAEPEKVCVADAIIDKVLANHNATRSFGGNSLIFCDRSISSRHKSSELSHFKALFEKAKSGDYAAQQLIDGLDEKEVIGALQGAFSVYDYIEEKLTQKGLNVAVVHDAKTPEQKARMQNDFNAGRIHAIIGSSQRLGAGWNLNERMSLLAHCDLPLRSSDYLQRNGRLERQGNQAYLNGDIQEVEICQVVTKKTLDSWFCDLLNRKVNFINAFNNNDLTVRTYEPEQESISFDELSAICSDNPNMLKLCKEKHEYKTLSIAKRAFDNKQYRHEDDIKFYNKRTNYLVKSLGSYLVDSKAFETLTTDNFHVNDQHISERALVELVQEAKNTLIRNSYRNNANNTEVICHFGEFEVLAVRNYLTYFYLRSTNTNMTYDVTPTGGSLGGRALFNAIEKQLPNLKSLDEAAMKEITDNNRELAYAEKERQKTFSSIGRLNELKDSILQLEKELAGMQEKEQQAA